jgi:hypothetical protein
MGRTAKWARIPAKSLDPKIYGRTVSAYCHKTGALLFHHKPVSRNSGWYNTYGMWVLASDMRIIRRQMYMHTKARKKPPLRWANRMLRADREGTLANDTPVGLLPQPAFDPYGLKTLAAHRRRPQRAEPLIGLWGPAYRDELPSGWPRFRPAIDCSPDGTCTVAERAEGRRGCASIGGYSRPGKRCRRRRSVEWSEVDLGELDPVSG